MAGLPLLHGSPLRIRIARPGGRGVWPRLVQPSTPISQLSHKRLLAATRSSTKSCTLPTEMALGRRAGAHITGPRFWMGGSLYYAQLAPALAGLRRCSVT